MPETLTLAVVLFPGLTTLDYLGPMELFGFLSPTRPAPILPSIPCNIDVTYVAAQKGSLTPGSGPKVLPDLSVEDVEKDGRKFDIVFVPGGIQSAVDAVAESVIDFLKVQAKTAKYVMSACTGSAILARAGILDGKAATTNKSSFHQVKGSTSPTITWVPKARWVVDGNVWTSSGVTAGMDMANAFLVRLIGEEATRTVRNIIEFTPKSEGEDEFAAVYELV